MPLRWSRTGKSFTNKMNTKIIFYVLASFLGTTLLAYFLYLTLALARNIQSITDDPSLKIPEVASFNLDKFQELKVPK